MSVVSLQGVDIINNPAKFGDKYEFEITFECLEELQKDLEWKLTYVGSATSDQYDQELDSLLVGPIPVGLNKFLFEADPPDTKRIPDAEIMGVTVILLTCAYDGREFVRVGYYVNNEYDSEELRADPPARPVIERIRRNILAEKPRVTRFQIKWDSEASAPAEFPPEQPEADLVADEDEYGAEELAEDEGEEEGGAGAATAEASGETHATAADAGAAGPSSAAAAVASQDAEMVGVEEEHAEENGVDEEELSDDGSVDIEGESEEEMEEEEEGAADGGEGGDAEMADAEEMEVDSGEPHDVQQQSAHEVMSH